MPAASSAWKSPKYRMDYANWIYFFTDDGILSCNVLTSKQYFAFVLAFLVSGGIFLALPYSLYSNPFSTPFPLKVLVVANFLFLLALYPIRGLATEIARRMLRRTSTEDIIESASPLTALISVQGGKRKLTRVSWDEIKSIELRRGNLTLRFGEGVWKRHESSPKFDAALTDELRSFLFAKIGGRLRVIGSVPKIE